MWLTVCRGPWIKEFNLFLAGKESSRYTHRRKVKKSFLASDCLMQHDRGHTHNLSFSLFSKPPTWLPWNRTSLSIGSLRVQSERKKPEPRSWWTLPSQLSALRPLLLLIWTFPTLSPYGTFIPLFCRFKAPRVTACSVHLFEFRGVQACTSLWPLRKVVSASGIAKSMLLRFLWMNHFA